MTAPFSCSNSCFASMRRLRIRSASISSAIVPAVGGEVEVVDGHVLGGVGVVAPAVALGEPVDVAGHRACRCP